MSPTGTYRQIGVKAFGDRLAEAWSALETLAARHDPTELNGVGFRAYERFRSDVPPGNES